MTSAKVTLIGAKSGQAILDREVELTELSPNVLIGRSSKNRLHAVPETRNGLFDCPVISRRHAELTLEGGVVKLTDLKSLHGTLVNHITLPAYKPHSLKHGDIITIGNSVNLGSQHYSAIVFQVNIKVTERKPQADAQQRNHEVIDLSSPVGSPKPPMASTPVWARPRTDMPAMKSFSTKSCSTYMVPELDDDEISSDGQSRPSSPLAARQDHTSSVDEDDDFSEHGASPEPQPMSESSESEEEESDEEGLEPRQSRYGIDDGDASDNMGESDFLSERENQEVIPMKSVYTPDTSDVSTSRSPSPRRDPAAQQTDDMSKSKSFFSKILADVPVRELFDMDKAPSSAHQSPSVDKATPPPPVTASHNSPVCHFQKPSAPAAQQSSGPYTSILNNSPYNSPYARSPPTQTVIEPPTDVFNCYTSPPPRFYSGTALSPPPPFPPPQPRPSSFTPFGNACSFSNSDPLFAPPSFLGRAPEPVPFSTWGPSPHEPHPFYPVHGVADGPLSYPPWGSQTTRSPRGDVPGLGAIPTGAAPQAFARTPPSISATKAPSAQHGPSQDPQHPKRNASTQAAAGFDDHSSARNDQSRMAIHNIISTQQAPEEKPTPAPSSKPVEPFVGMKRKAEHLCSTKPTVSNDEVSEGVLSPTIEERAPGDDTKITCTSTVIAAVEPRSEEPEPPTKRARVALGPKSVNVTAPRTSRARQAASTAAKYGLAAVLGGVVTVGSVLALPASYFT